MPPMVFKRAPPPEPKIQRLAIRSPDEADEPRSRLELNALRALGTILDKPEWWTQWTKRPEMQAKWIAEMEDELVHANVRQVLSVWPRADCVATTHELLATVRKIVAMKNGSAKKAKIEELLTHVLYPPAENDAGFEEGGGHECDEEDEDDSEDEDEDEVEGDADSDDETALDEDGNVVTFDAALTQAKKTHGIPTEIIDVDCDESMEDDDDESATDAALETHKKKNPFGQIAWFVAMCLIREQLLAIAPADWTEANIVKIVEEFEILDNEALIKRACSLILAVVRATVNGQEVAIETVKAHVPEETRAHVFEILTIHFQAARQYLETVKNDVATVLDILISRLALPAKDEMTESEPLRTPGPVPHSWMSDGLISNELKAKLLSEVAVLENEANSSDQIVDLVDPSLYCGVIGKTGRLPQSTAKKTYGTPIQHLGAIISECPKGKLAGPKKTTKFQWLPCEIDVDEAEEGGNASIVTYINNLQPEKFTTMYQSIEKVFTKFVPLFETVLSSLDDQALDRASQALYEHGQATLPCPPSLVPPGLFETSDPRLTLKGTRCQVIVKISEIRLTPKKPSFAGGAWHVEGTDAERIIATGRYYFGSENVTESQLSFRTFVKLPEGEENDQVGVGLEYGIRKNSLLAQNFGSVTTREDRCVVFPNTYEQKIEPFSLADPMKPGVQRVLTFFLVDPTETPIPSTAVIPPQQQEWIDLGCEPQLKRLRLSDSVRNEIKDSSHRGLNLEQAKEIRATLLAERAPVNREGDLDFVFSPRD